MDKSAKIDVVVHFKGMGGSDALREYAEKKAAKLEKYVHHLTHCHFNFAVEKERHIAQLHVVSGDFDARAEAVTENSVYEAVDEVTDKIVNQARKHNGKGRDKSHGGRPHHNNE